MAAVPMGFVIAFICGAISESLLLNRIPRRHTGDVALLVCVSVCVLYGLLCILLRNPLKITAAAIYAHFATFSFVVIVIGWPFIEKCIRRGT